MARASSLPRAPGFIIKGQNKAAALLFHVGSIDQLARAAVQDLLPFLCDNAAQLASFPPRSPTDLVR